MSERDAAVPAPMMFIDGSYTVTMTDVQLANLEAQCRAEGERIGREAGMREAAGIAATLYVLPETNAYAEWYRHAKSIEAAILSAIGEPKKETPAASTAWPAKCPKNASCARHRACMYSCEAHYHRPHEELAAEIDAETARRQAIGEPKT